MVIAVTLAFGRLRSHSKFFPSTGYTMSSRPVWAIAKTKPTQKYLEKRNIHGYSLNSPFIYFSDLKFLILKNEEGD